jgi:hypothetical protein
LYLSFQEKAEKVADDIDNADTALADRYFAITGFEPDASPGFNKQFPIPTAGSELGAVLTEIAGLQEQSDLRTSLTANFDDLVKTNADATKAGFAQQSVTLAQDKENVINNAVSTYKDKAGKLYDSTTAMKTIAAASQATMDATSAAAGCDNPIAGGTALAVGAVNIAIQTATTAVIADNDKNIDFAGVDLSATTSKADIALTVNQSRLDLESLKRNIIANNMAAKSDKSALMQALAHKAALLAELDRIEKKRDSTVAAIRKKSYADPMNYYRAEAALIDADESFATAQRWMFYTLQALNYKWNGKFAIVQGSKRYDTSTLFKSRNAMELNDLLTQMDEWDNIRKAQTINSARIYTRISLLEHILARNPQRFSLTDSSDPGTRVDTTSATTPRPALYTLDFFRRLLTAKYTEAGSGDLVIPFSTVFPNQAPDRVDGFFFRGATYDTAGTIIDQGFWREKIEYVKVNIVASNAPATPSAYGGALTYGGTTYFHTRVPPRSDRTVAGLAIDDAPGELLVAPFRFWQSPDFSLNGFQASSQQVVPIGVAYARDSAFVSGTTPDNLSSSFQVNDFVGRSIATTGWILRIYRSQVNGIVVNADNISDIEILVAYKHSTRVFPPN